MQVPYQPTGDTQPSNQPLQTQSPEGLSADAFGAGIGRGLENFANGVGGVADYFEQRAEQAQRFAATSALANFTSSVNDQFLKRAQSYDPSTASNFPQDLSDIFTQEKQKFVDSLPPALQDQYSAQADQVGSSLHTDAVKFQIGAMGDYAKQSISDAYDKARIALDSDGGAKNLDAQRASLDTMISQAPLTPPEKTALRRQVYAGIEGASYKSEVRNGKLSVDALGVGSSAAAGALTLLQNTNPKLDGPTLKATAQAGETIATKQVDPAVWGALTDPVKAALITVVAQKGELPQTVLDAVNGGGDISGSIKALNDPKLIEAASVVTGDTILPLSQPDADPRYSDIPYEDRVSLRADAEREATDAANATATLTKARNNQVVNNLMDGLYDGSAGQTDIDKLRGLGILTDYDDIKKAQDILDTGDGQRALMSRGLTMLQTGQTFNPSDNRDVKTENALVGQIGLAAMQQQNSQYVTDILAPMVRKMQDIPTDTKGLLTDMSRSNDRSKALWAFSTMAQLEEASPGGFAARMDDSTVSDLELWRTGKDYYDQDKLFQLLQGGDTQEMRVRTQALREQARGLLNDKEHDPVGLANIPTAMGVSGGFFGLGATTQQAVPWASQGLMADFRDLFTTEYARSGNIDMAKQTALKLLQKNWGVTNVGGQSTLMKFPPEKVGYTPVNGNFDWMTQQGTKDLALAPGEKFQLIADDQTRHEFETWQGGGADAPSYRAVILGTDGNYRMFQPWKPGADRLSFDITPFRAQQAQDWMTQRKQLLDEEASRGLGDTLQHHKETGAPVPPSVLNDYLGALSQQPMSGAQPIHTIIPDDSNAPAP